LIVDFQERLAAAMPPGERQECERNVLTLIEVAKRLGLPVMLSEQYPKGLGATVPSIAAALGGVAGLERIEKLEFACTDSAAFRAPYDKFGREQWIVAGMEAHVCVYQTVRGLIDLGATVHVPGDAVISRAAANHRIGLGLVERAGAVVTSTEVVAFDLLQRAGTDDFKAISKLIR
jgi:nicotinamidase-related amidase